MKEINIARKLIAKRREKGVTQEELARYIGVSKASVSKWETGQSYPDITFLPLLSAYYNISIDELMGYEPQMTKEDILKLYHELSEDFARRPFDEVMARCHAVAKKYYACFPLLFQIGVLFINYSMLPGDVKKTAAVLTQAKELFIRVKQESDDPELSKMALNMEALCLLSLGNPGEVLELLKDVRTKQPVSVEGLLASAYHMTGRTGEAKAELQIDSYLALIRLLESLRAYMELCTDDLAVWEETHRRMQIITEVFELRKLHPVILMNQYLSAAGGFLRFGKQEEALTQLEGYCEIVCGDIYPLTLHGDTFFTQLDTWFADMDMGPYPPRDEKTIRQSMLDAVIGAPHFAALQGEPRFEAIRKKLQKNRREY